MNKNKNIWNTAVKATRVNYCTKLFYYSRTMNKYFFSHYHTNK